jgi:REP element-mobilizing transposase RayT
MHFHFYKRVMMTNDPKVEAASSRFQEFGYIHKDQDIVNLSGNLPHWRQEAVTYFVTFRTADSLPQEKLKLWQTEKDEWLKQHPEPHDNKTKREFYEKFPNRIQIWLDQGYGASLLGIPEYKAIVESALEHFDGDRYDLDEFVIMPNHVHAIVTPKNEHVLSHILHSWKSFTSNKINKKSGKNGAFWQKESFDHIVRSPEQLERIRSYIREHSAFEEKRQDAASTFT